MPLFARSYQELMAESLEDLAINTNITRLSAGGIARGLLESVNKRMAESYSTFDQGLARAFVSSAPGQYLDLIGTLLGVEREASVAANVDAETEVIKLYVDSGTFGDINGSNDIVFSQGSIISTATSNGGTLYRVTSSVTLSASAAFGWVSATAVVPGEAANIGTGSLTFHDFVNYTDYLNRTLLVTNIHQIANGKNFEDDENYRFRIVNRVLEVEAANQTAIRLAALSTPGVADVILIPRYRGIGTQGVIIQSVLPVVSQTLIDAASANIQRVQAFGDITYVRGPKETGTTMKITVHYDRQLPEDELNGIEEALKDSITEFINNLDIAESLLTNRLVSELFAVSEYIANFGESGKPFDEFYIHVNSKLEDNKVRQVLLGDYVPEDDERVIIEPSFANPITFERAFIRR